MHRETTPNCWPDRRGETVRGIVVHVTEGSYESARNWIKNPISSASYHYVIKEDGEPVQFVNPAAAAWANGLVVDSVWKDIIPGKNPNLYTISIAYAGHGHIGPTMQQAITIASLIKQLAAEYDLPIDANHVIPHNYIRRDKTCPGTGMDLDALRWLAALPV